MFYCDPCADRNEWPHTTVTSAGRCEICGLSAYCNDLPSALLLPVPAAVLVSPEATVWVTCGGCDRALVITHGEWHGNEVAPCPACDAGADLVHARRHVSCGICET